MHFFRGPFLSCSVILLAAVAPGACGGTTVVDGTGGEGSGANSGVGGAGAAGAASAVAVTASGTSSSVAVSSSSGGPGDCEVLEAQMVAAYQAAVACDPSIDVEQCTGATVGKYYCGCTVVANDQLPDEAALSLALGTQWEDMGCEYNFCESGCYPTDAPWYCDPNTNRCAPAFE